MSKCTCADYHVGFFTLYGLYWIITQAIVMHDPNSLVGVPSYPWCWIWINTIVIHHLLFRTCLMASLSSMAYLLSVVRDYNIFKFSYFGIMTNSWQSPNAPAQSLICVSYDWKLVTYLFTFWKYKMDQLIVIVKVKQDKIVMFSLLFLFFAFQYLLVS